MAENGLIRHVELSLSRLPANFDGLRVAFMSDLHFAGVAGRLEESIGEALEKEAPDVLVFGGDMINHPRYWEAASAWLRTIDVAPHRIAVPGNWEYKFGGTLEAYRSRMAEARFQVLCNESCFIEENEGRLRVTGLDDVRKGHPDVEGAFTGDADVFTLAVCHSPDILITLSPERFDLLLCGHTHGGQWRIPGIGAVITSTRLWKKYEAGLYKLPGGQYVYVTRGLSGRIKLRIFCPPEIVVLTLRRVMDAGGA